MQLSSFRNSFSSFLLSFFFQSEKWNSLLEVHLCNGDTSSQPSPCPGNDLSTMTNSKMENMLVLMKWSLTWRLFSENTSSKRSSLVSIRQNDIFLSVTLTRHFTILTWNFSLTECPWKSKCLPFLREKIQKWHEPDSILEHRICSASL